MDRSLKERLVGASVLVGLAVWLIPWVLDGPVPGPEFRVPQEPATEVSAPLRTQTIRLENPQNSSARVGATDISGSSADSGSRPIAPVQPAPGGMATVSSGTTRETPGGTVAGWLVQVGSFGDEENARRQANRVADAGYTARLYPHTSGGRLMCRVRVGPEPSREGADEIASSLRDEGFVAQVVSND